MTLPAPPPGATRPRAARPALWAWTGGPVGKRARLDGYWFNPAPWAVLTAVATWFVLMVRQVPCLQTTAGVVPNTFEAMCYSDIPILYQARGLSTGHIPMVQAPLEYPVLTAGFMELGRRLVVLLGGRSAPDVSAQEAVSSALLFFGINAVLLFGLFLVLVVTHLRMGRPWDALMIAASPTVAAAGLINWDLLVVALTSLSLLLWARRREVLGGAVLGLAVAAKLYPVLLLLPLAALCLRAGRGRDFARFAGAAGLTWLAINLPLIVLAPEGWLNFWTFNVDRGGDLGSIWYVLSLAGTPVPNVSAVVAVLLLVCGIGVGALMLLAPRRPRLAQGAFLIVVAFLVLNKVYSPQYVLWLLPLLVLARPNWRDALVFTLAELGYWAAIWGHLAGTLHPGNGGPDRLYWLAVIVRVGVQLWLAALVVRDILRPEDDPVRAPSWAIDDPDGGVLDQAGDVGWVLGLRRALPGGARAWAEPQGDPHAPAAMPPTDRVEPQGAVQTSAPPPAAKGSPAPEAPGKADPHRFGEEAP